MAAWSNTSDPIATTACRYRRSAREGEAGPIAGPFMSYFGSADVMASPHMIDVPSVAYESPHMIDWPCGS